ncbi:MAG: BACON domain-containing protein [Muribaculaceae bacterium]|nr:BACON domain-containing protein [Muribaculaceae bacterium]
MNKFILASCSLLFACASALAVNSTLSRAHGILNNAQTIADYQKALGQFQAAKKDVGYTPKDQSAINNGIKLCNQKINALKGASTPKPAPRTDKVDNTPKQQRETSTLLINGSTSPSISLSSDGGYKYVSLTTNQGWPEIYNLPNWLVAEYDGDGELELSWDPNNSRESRTATFRVAAGSKTVNVSVRQDPGDYKLELTGIRYANTCSGETLTDYGKPLYADEMRFLAPEILYLGGKQDEEHTVQVKIFNPNGLLRQASNSPENYTSAKDIYFLKKQSESDYLKALGNSKASTFEAGQYRVEVYLDHELALVDHLYINSRGGYASYLTVDNNNYVESLFDSTGESHDYKIRTDGTWSMAEVPTWCRAQMDGDILRVYATPNEDYSPRYGTMSVKSGDKIVNIRLHQTGK